MTIKEIKYKYFYFNTLGHKFYTYLSKYGNFLGESVCQPVDLAPFFIVGSGRSGSTLLRKQLITRHRGIVIPPETYVIGRMYRLFLQYRSMPWRQKVYILIANIEYHKEFKTFNIESLRELAEDLVDTPKDERSLSKIITEFYKFYANEKYPSYEIIGDKTPSNTLYINEIHKIFPQSKFIHIIRDGVDVVYSYLQSGIYDNCIDAACRWKYSVKTVNKFQKKFPHLVKVVRYEEFVNNVDQTYKDILNYLGINDDANKINKVKNIDFGDIPHHKHHKKVLKKVDDKSINKGRINMSNEMKAKISSILNNILLDNGYKTVK